jgi:hypothetical protein
MSHEDEGDGKQPGGHVQKEDEDVNEDEVEYEGDNMDEDEDDNEDEDEDEDDKVDADEIYPPLMTNRMMNPWQRQRSL